MADADCEVLYTPEEDCCNVPMAGSIEEPEPPVITPEPPEPECPYYCGFGIPEGVQESTFNNVAVIGGHYLQLDADPTSHPGWVKETVGGNTGWSYWAGLGNHILQSYRLGDGSLASGIASLALGKNTLASGQNAEAIGNGSQATADNAKAFGAGAIASKAGAIAFGFGALSDVLGGVAVGQNAKVNSHPAAIVFTFNNIALGNGAETPTNGEDNITIGDGLIDPYGVIAIGNQNGGGLTPGAGVNFNTTWGSIHIGHFQQIRTGHHNGGMITIGSELEVDEGATFTDQVIIGHGIYSWGPDQVLVGGSIIAYADDNPVSGLKAATVATGIGFNVRLNGDCIVAAGHDSIVRSDFSSAIGPHARAGKDQTTDSCNALGRFATALGHRSQALGVNAIVADGHTASIALGYNSLTTAAAQLMIGDDAASAQINLVHFNGAASPAITIDSSGRATFIGTVATPSTTLTAGTLLNTTHGTVRVDTGIGNLTVDLPAAASVTSRIYTIIKVSADANTVTIDGNGAETINGVGTKVLTTQYEKVVIQSNGTSWDIIG